jgi:hypothetical protein
MTRGAAAQIIVRALQWARDFSFPANEFRGLVLFQMLGELLSGQQSASK